MKRCEACGAALPPQADVCPACGCRQQPVPPNALQPGMKIAGRYRVEAVAGVGGFGITYRAFDETLACTVAVKEYFPSGIANRIPGSTEVLLYAGKRAVEFRRGYERFLNEARSMMQFCAAANIIQVREYFEANGTAYIVMEYLQGRTLKAEIETAPLSWERSVEIGTAVCGALAQLHRKGVVHRDISPDNIFLCRDGTVKLIDFGAARAAMRQDRQLTVVFKDCFTPPEQYASTARQGPQTDIYALGATLYMAMTGKAPESALNRQPVDRLKPPYALRPDIPEGVGNAVMQAMALEPELRFPDADAFARALKQYQTAQSMEAVRRKKRRRRRVSLLAAFLVLAAVGAAVSALWIGRVQNTTLPDAEIFVWFSADPLSQSGQNKIAALHAAADAFSQRYPNVTLRLQSILPDEYADRIKQAQQDGSMPALFERTADTDAALADDTALRSLARAHDPAQYRLSGLVSADHAALGCGMPVLYVASAYTGGEIGALQKADASLPAELAARGSPVGFKASAIPLYEALLQSPIPTDEPFSVREDARDGFVRGERMLYYGDTADAADLQQAMAGRYRAYALETDAPVCQLQNVWSVAAGTAKKERRCAARFLSYLLSEDGQRCLYLENSYPCVPVLNAVYEQYRRLAGELSAVLDERQPQSCGIG